MAEEHGGQQSTSWPWLKLFTAFKIAVLPSKLFLAAAGIFIMALGWNVLGWIFFSIRSEPKAADYKDDWKGFQQARASWNLFYEMAGNESRPEQAEDVVDKIADYKQFLAIKNATDIIKFKFQGTDEDSTMDVGNTPYAFKADKAVLETLKSRTYYGGQISVIDAEKGKASVAGNLIDVKLKQVATLQEFVATIKDMDRNSLKIADELINQPTYKRYGYLRSWPWSEYRGPNPYLVLTEPSFRQEYISGFFATQVPVLLEPLNKFFAPILYFLNPAATFGIRFYLFLVILWTLAVWAFFGGAISRIAVVQAARPNEKVGMMEALRFSRSRLQSLFSAPLIPLFFLAFLTFIMIILGEIEGWTFWLGDIVLAFFFWPLFLIFGLIMAIVLIGLIGWPLMYTTISAEGSDSFDALSRSYSYVFQGIWRYLWYCIVAVAYGIVLVFFVVLMASLTVYLAKWGVSQAPLLSSKEPARDREPTYFFVHAPRSFGWRDLFLYDSRFKEIVPIHRQDGKPGREVVLTKDYRENISLPNHIGAFLVSIWVYLLFLMMLGFSYSYFWTASSIIYLLMRKYVDDTEFDEIHLEEEDEEPMPEMPVSMAPGTTPPAAPPASQGFSMVDSPTLRPAATPPAPLDTPSMPPRTANPTMLARDEPPPESRPPEAPPSPDNPPSPPGGP
jgi:hypothetical protein